VFFLFPVGFMFLPLFFERPDYFPMVVLLDDLFILVLSSIFIRELASKEVVREHLGAMSGSPQLERFRQPNEDGSSLKGGAVLRSQLGRWRKDCSMLGSGKALI